MILVVGATGMAGGMILDGLLGQGKAQGRDLVAPVVHQVHPMHVAPGATDTFDPSTGEVQEGDLAPAPDNTDTDVSISVNHRVHRVLLKTTLRDLTEGYTSGAGTKRGAVPRVDSGERSAPRALVPRAIGIEPEDRGTPA